MTLPGAPTAIPSGVFGSFSFRPIGGARAGSALNLINVKLVDAGGNVLAPAPELLGGIVRLTDVPDGDNDGCGDMREPLLNPPTNPLDPWDFYSVPVPSLLAAPNPLIVFRDGLVSSSDAQSIFSYFRVGAQTGMPQYDQDLNLNGVADGIEYDRSVAGTGGHSGPPDGVISASDAQLANTQFAHGYSC